MSERRELVRWTAGDLEVRIIEGGQRGYDLEYLNMDGQHPRWTILPDAQRAFQIVVARMLAGEMRGAA